MSVADLNATPCRHCKRTWRECMEDRYCCLTCRRDGGHSPGDPRPNDDLDPSALYERVRALTEENHRLSMRNATLEERIVEQRKLTHKAYTEHPPAVAVGPDVALGDIAEQDALTHDGNPWDPVTWEAEGFVRNFGDAAVMSPYFEILKRESAQRSPRGRPETQFVILCPTFLRRPVTISSDGWAGY